jgi:hypothetical protein
MDPDPFALKNARRCHQNSGAPVNFAFIIGKQSLNNQQLGKSAETKRKSAAAADLGQDIFFGMKIACKSTRVLLSPGITGRFHCFSAHIF